MATMEMATMEMATKEMGTTEMSGRIKRLGHARLL